MGGLLYKDFVITCKLKKFNLVCILLVGILLFSVLRVVFPGTNMNPDFLISTENGEVINIMDLFFVIMLFCFILFCMSLVNSFVAKIVEGDEKNKIKGYLRVMPLGKYDYIASKYIFIGITCYVLLSLDLICSVVCTGYCLDGIIKDIAQFVTSSCVIYMGLSIFLATIELPLFITYGKEKAMYGKIVVGIVIALSFAGYVLFGDISIFDNIDVFKLMNWMNKHQTEMTVVSAFLPALVMLAYFGSYKLCCKLADKEEA